MNKETPEETRTIQVIILPNGREARERNLFGDKRPNPPAPPFLADKERLEQYARSVRIKQYDWDQKQSKLRTFTIDPDQLFEQCGDQFTPGSTHTAEIIDEEKLIVRIVS